MSDERTTQRKPGWRERWSESLKSAPRRRTLAIVAGVALAAVLLLAVPAYIAAQPQFFKRYPDIESHVKSWQASVHAKVPCQGCHVAPGFAPQATFDARMLGEFYLSYAMRSRQPEVLGTPTNEACARCHVDLRSVSPSGDLNIPHRAHIEVLGLKCVRCHEFLVHEKSPEGSHKPRMIACMTCHDGKQAKNACSTCHTRKAAPPGHSAKDWVIVHADKQKEIDCAKCHGWTANWCEECHSRRPRSHVAGWRAKHADQVKIRRNCEVCHVADFCTRCHGEVPALNFDPTIKLIR